MSSRGQQRVAYSPVRRLRPREANGKPTPLRDDGAARRARSGLDAPIGARREILRRVERGRGACYHERRASSLREEPSRARAPSLDALIGARANVAARGGYARAPDGTRGTWIQEVVRSRRCKCKLIKDSRDVEDDDADRPGVRFLTASGLLCLRSLTPPAGIHYESPSCDRRGAAGWSRRAVGVDRAALCRRLWRADARRHGQGEEEYIQITFK